MKHIKFLLDEFSTITIYSKIKQMFDNERVFLFESVINNSDGNFSYIVVGEKEKIIYKDYKTHYFDENSNEKILDKDPFEFLKDYYKNIDFEKYKKLSKEIGIGYIDGFIGYIGYDMVKVFEPVLQDSMDNLKDETNIPDFYMIRPKLILGYSHKKSLLTIVSNDESISDLEGIKQNLFKDCKHIPLKKANILKEPKFVFDKEQFMDLVKKAKKNIEDGDIFQIVLSNRLKITAEVDKFSFYRKLRSKNPSPYLYFLDFDEFSIIGSSPEIMVRLTDGVILLRPIAGTRKRGDSLKKDLALEKDMINDKKEIAEHIMLVDLGRNDVGRVAKAGSVKVEELMRVERYSHVMHMVSDVVGEIDDKYDMFDLFKATFTAGTMTGSPKIKAMELIANYEGLKRGYYAGSIGYFGFDGNMDSAITIRTALIKEKEIIFQAGAGVVADSKPELEFLEIENKLKALVTTLKELNDD